MIVKKPIGPIKIDNTISRLTVGQAVPKKVIDFWKESGQIDELKRIGAISIDDISEEKKISKGQSKKKTDAEQKDSQGELLNGSL